MIKTAVAPQPKYKMPARKGGTFGPPPEPAYQVCVLQRGTEKYWEGGELLYRPFVTTLTFSARDEREAARIVDDYADDYPVKVVPRGMVADSLEWTQPGE